jgi:hypothetical protein
LGLPGPGAVALAQVPPPSSYPLPALAVAWFRSGTSKACPLGRFVVVGGYWVVLVGYRGGLTPPVPSAMGLEDGCHLPLIMFRRKPSQFCAGPATTTPEGVVSLPAGVVVRSQGTSSFLLAIALCHIIRRGLLGILCTVADDLYSRPRALLATQRRAHGENGCLTAGSTPYAVRAARAGSARAYPGAARGGADSRGPRCVCLPWDGALLRGTRPRAVQPP